MGQIGKMLVAGGRGEVGRGNCRVLRKLRQQGDGGSCVRGKGVLLGFGEDATMKGEEREIPRKSSSKEDVATIRRWRGRCRSHSFVPRLGF